MFWASVPLLRCPYTGILEVQSFSIVKWNFYLLFSNKLKILNIFWLFSKYGLKDAFHLKKMHFVSLQPGSLDTEKMFITKIMGFLYLNNRFFCLCSSQIKLN